MGKGNEKKEGLGRWWKVCAVGGKWRRLTFLVKSSKLRKTSRTGQGNGVVKEKNHEKAAIRREGQSAAGRDQRVRIDSTV